MVVQTMYISSTKRTLPSRRPATPPASNAVEKSEVPVGQEKDWTVIFYNAGHNDEAKMCTYSLDRLEEVGSDENTHLVVMNHRRRWVGDQLLGRFGDYEDTKTHYVTKAEPESQPIWEKPLPDDAQALSQVLRTGPHKIHSPVIDEHPENPNMGEAQVLKKCILDNMERFPSKHVCVVMNGHGAAFQGQMIVHSPEGRMTNEEIGKVFEEITEETGKKVDTLNLNTCFSANMESLYPMGRAADAIVASESTVFAGTQPLSETVGDLQQALKEGVDLDGKDLARLFVERARQQEMGNLFTPTLSALDPAQFSPVADAVKSLQDTLMKEKVEPSLLKECAEKSTRFNYSSIPRDIWVTDLGSFAKQVHKRVPSEKAKKAAQAVTESLNKCVLAEQHAEHHKETVSTKSLRLILGKEENLDGATGLTVYYDTDVNNDSRLHRIEGMDYGKVNEPGKFMKYISQATEAERNSAGPLKKVVTNATEGYSKWKRRTSQKIPIPKALEMAETVGMGAASYLTFSNLAKAGIPAGEYLFGTYFTGKGLYDVGSGTVALAKGLSQGSLSPAQKEEMVDQAAKVAVGACMGTFGLTIFGALPEWVAWPACLGALGLRAGKELVKLAVRKPELEAHRQGVQDYNQSSAAEKLAAIKT
jgi:hypothetical protein